MAMADILALTSGDAEFELEARELGFGHPEIPLHGTTVADILLMKRQDIATHRARYDAVRQNMIEQGQTAGIAVRAGYLVNGGHRVALAIELGWPGLWATDDCSESTDHAYDEAHDTEQPW